MIDPCPNDLGRDVELMAEISARTGFRIVCATGLYKEDQGGTPYWKLRRVFGAAAESINAFKQIFHCQTVEKGLDLFAQLAFSPFNWILGDADGNIGYQLAGLFPSKRAGTTGLLPYLGWDPADDWTGTGDPRKQPRRLNPEDGIVITANNDLNQYGDVQPITCPCPVIAPT